MLYYKSLYSLSEPILRITTPGRAENPNKMDAFLQIEIPMCV